MDPPFTVSVVPVLIQSGKAQTPSNCVDEHVDVRLCLFFIAVLVYRLRQSIVSS